MHRLLPLVAFALALATPSLLPADVKIVCFGDSITYGVFDSEDFGYPGYLEGRLTAAGWSVDVVNAGADGEKASAGMSRIETVLSNHPDADFVAIMEGTNDISSNDSNANILLYLETIGGKVDDAGAIPVMATLIPRFPCATKDALNGKTYTLGQSILAKAALNGWPSVDPYAYFESLPNLFENYYFYVDPYPSCQGNWDSYPGDPGHPNSAGHPKLTDPFEARMLELLAAGLRIIPPSSPFAGDVLTFGASLFRDDYTELEWEFGDGGRATTSPVGADPTVQYRYLEAGTYTVTVHWKRSGGGTGSTSRQIVVQRPTPAWTERVSLVPLAFRGDGAAPDDLRFDLALDNSGAQATVAEVRLLEQPAGDEPLPLLDLIVEAPEPKPGVAETIDALRESVPSPGFPILRFFIGAGGSRTEVDLLEHRFGTTSLRAAVEVRFHVPQGSPTAGLSASGELFREGYPHHTIVERPAASWDPGAVGFASISPGADDLLSVAVTNLGATDAVFDLHLFDGSDDPVGDATLTALRGQTAAAALDALFPSIGSHAAPFRLEIDAAAVDFEAAVVAVDAVGGGVLELPPTP